MVLTDGYTADVAGADTGPADTPPAPDAAAWEVTTPDAHTPDTIVAPDVAPPLDVPPPDGTVCVPSCGDKECGPDGCGGVCGVCAAGAECYAGQCVGLCTPQCGGKECGDDGCGGSCGACAAGAECYAGQCVTVCVPQCDGKECGDDGCGGSCGACAAGGQCVDGACTPDPCQPNPCTLPPAAVCDGQTARTWEPMGVCEPSPYGGAPHCTYLVAGEDSCADQGLVCATGKCVPPDDPTNYEPGPSASYVTELHVANQQGNPVCCFDLDGDGTIDNALGDLLDSASSLLGGASGVDEDLAAAIQSGDLAMIFEWKGLDVPPGGGNGTLPEDDAVEVNLFQGSGGTYAGSLDGNGTWTVTPGSFIPGTAQPAGAVGAGSIVLGGAHVGPGNITLPLPLLGVVTDIQIAPSYMEGTTFWGANLVGLDVLDGKLGGAVPIAAVYAAFNAYVDDMCPCLGLTDGLITPTSDGGGQCNEAPGFCGDSSCDQLAQICPFVVSMIAPDLDVDGDGTYDSLSVGLTFEAVSTNIEGVAP